MLLADPAAAAPQSALPAYALLALVVCIVTGILGSVMPNLARGLLALWLLFGIFVMQDSGGSLFLLVFGFAIPLAGYALGRRHAARTTEPTVRPASPATLQPTARVWPSAEAPPPREKLPNRPARQADGTLAPRTECEGCGAQIHPGFPDCPYCGRLR